jgi:Tfp pilus assembly protein PilO
MAVGVILAVTLMLCAVFYFFVFQPQQEKVGQLRDDLAAAEQELATRQQLARDIDKLREETERITKLVNEFEERLPSRREIATLLTQFEDIAGEVGGLDVEMRAQAPRREGMKQTIPYRIVARGSFPKIVEFINRLERFKRYLKVSDLEIGRQENGVSEAEFTLSTYTFIESGTGGAA